ncbi:MAG: hypothetical protein WC749_02985 [Dehalococcoidia bacterium]
MPRKKARKTPPYRQEFDKANPVVSLRLTLQEYAALQEMKKSQNKTNADIMKIGMGIVKDRAIREAEFRDQGFSAGQVKGFSLAEAMYRVDYRCTTCEQSKPITTPEEKRVAAQYTRILCGGHAICPGRMVR